MLCFCLDYLKLKAKTILCNLSTQKLKILLQISLKSLSLQSLSFKKLRALMLKASIMKL